MTGTNEHPELADLADERWEALARYVTGEASTEEVAAIREWLAGSPGRGSALERLTASIERLAVVPPQVDTVAALARVRARLGSPEVIPLPVKAPERPRIAWRTTLVRVAAAIVLLAGATLILRNRRSGPETGIVAAVPMAWSTAVGQVDSITLPDGSRVILGPASRLSLGEGFGDVGRTAELQGEALFTIVHDEARPFSVRAGDARIRDLGTAFNVRSGVGLPVIVAVTDGSVELTAGGTVGVTLAAGDRGTVGRDGVIAVEAGSVTDADVAWTSGRLVFADAGMDRVAADLERWFGLRLAPDPGLADRHLTATFDGESADEVLDVIALSLGASYERSGDTVRLRTGGSGTR